MWKNQIAGADSPGRNGHSVMDLLESGAVQPNTGLCVSPPDQPGTVEAVRPRGAPDIGAAESAQCCPHRDVGGGTTPSEAARTATGAAAVSQGQQRGSAPSRASSRGQYVALLGAQTDGSAAQQFSGHDWMRRWCLSVRASGRQHCGGGEVRKSVVAPGGGEDASEFSILRPGNCEFRPPQSGCIPVSDCGDAGLTR